MINPSILKIYHASAGSGKTYNLIKEYLILILNTKDLYKYQNILIITFTNKVSTEIKNKILNELFSFSIKKETKMLHDIAKNINEKYYNIFYKSKQILKIILHNYERFNIITIDKFIYKIINNSFLELKIYNNYSLELETKSLLKEAINILLSNLKKNNFYSKIIIYTTLNKIYNGKNINYYNNILNIYNNFSFEKNNFFLEKISCFTENDFYNLYKKINYKIDLFNNYLIKQSKNFFNFLKNKNIDSNSFYFSLLPNFYKKINNNNIIIYNNKKLFSKKLENNLIIGKFYSNKISKIQKKIINKYSLFFYKNYFKLKNYIIIYKNYYIINQILKKNFIYFITLYKINFLLKKIKKNKKLFFISDINYLLYNMINNENIPYYYEYIGEKYKHYFIDEFQDTSTIQWYNIKPFIENSLSEDGTIFLLGDIKQSIYRWRGGDLDLFIDLLNNKYFNYKKEIEYSIYNYRSCKQIVAFNNSLYYSAYKTLKTYEYKNIFNTLKQKYYINNNGYVEINCLNDIKNSLLSIYQYIKKKINHLISLGIKKNDIAILCRKNEEILLFNNLFKNDDIIINSTNTLLLKNYWQIDCIIKLLYIIAYPDNNFLKIQWLLLLIKYKIIIIKEIEIHNFLYKMLNINLTIFLKKLQYYGLFFNIYLYKITSIYILIEKIINSMNLNKYEKIINSFLDFVALYLKKIENSIIIFLNIWENKKDKEYISISNNIDEKINIMTIHSSKGLEFQTVFLPLIYWKISKSFMDWIDINPNYFCGFNHFYIKMQKSMLHMDNYLFNLYQKGLDKIYIDNINLLYVATTRAKQNLIIFTSFNKKDNISYYIKNFLIEKKLFIENKLQYKFI